MAALPRQSHRRRDWFSTIGQKLATKSILSPTSSKHIEIDWIRLQRFSNSGFRERDNQSAARCWTDPSRRAGRTTSRAAQTLQVLNSWEILWGRFCLWTRADIYKKTFGGFDPASLLWSSLDVLQPTFWNWNLKFVSNTLKYLCLGVW